MVYGMKGKDRGQRTEVRRQRTEDRRQRTEGGGRRAEGGGRPGEIRFTFVKCATLSQVNLTWQAVTDVNFTGQGRREEKG